MLHSKKWITALALSLILVSAFFVGVPRVSASSTSHRTASMTHSPKIPAISTCGFNGGNFDMDVVYNNWNNTVYFCGTGYLGYRITNVNEVYDNSGLPMWVRWYSPGNFCSLSGVGAYADFSPPALITQVDIGSSHSGSVC